MLAFTCKEATLYVLFYILCRSVHNIVDEALLSVRQGIKTIDDDSVHANYGENCKHSLLYGELAFKVSLSFCSCLSAFNGRDHCEGVHSAEHGSN